MKEYKEAEVEIIMIEQGDIITLSGENELPLDPAS